MNRVMVAPSCVGLVLPTGSASNRPALNPQAVSAHALGRTRSTARRRVPISYTAPGPLGVRPPARAQRAAWPNPLGRPRFWGALPAELPLDLAGQHAPAPAV